MSTILVVEDDPTVRAVMVNSLEPMGHVIIAASTSEEALCHVRERGDKLDLLLVDVRLPLVSGLSVARQLRSFRGDLPVVLTSGHTPDLWNQTELANLGDIHGPNIRFLPKPVHRLDSEVGRFTRSRRMRSHSNAGRPVCVKTILTEALKFGAWDVLPKPLNTAEVVRSVRYGFERLRNQDRVGPVAKALAAAG